MRSRLEGVEAEVVERVVEEERKSEEEVACRW